MNDQDRLLKPREAAEFLSVKLRTIYAWAAQGKIPYRRAGTELRFLRSELLEWTAPRGGGRAGRPDVVNSRRS